MITFHCTQCGKAHSVEDAMSGASITCDACGAALSVPSPSAVPALEYASAPPRDGPEFERPGQQDFVNGLIATCKSLITAPTRTFATMKPEGDYGKPILFAVICGAAGGVMSAFWNFFWTLISGAGFGVAMVQGVVIAIVSPIAAVAGLFIGGGLVHLALIILKGNKRGFESTARVIAYCSVFQLCNIIPFVGPLAGAVWCIVVEIIGVREMHETTTGKAVGAVLLPVAVCCLCVGLFFAAVFVFGAVAASSPGRHF